MNAIIVFMKYPEIGKVKTRLGSTIGLEKAARLYRLFIDDTLTLVDRTKAENKFAAIAPPEKESQFAVEILPVGFRFLPGIFEDAGIFYGKTYWLGCCPEYVQEFFIRRIAGVSYDAQDPYYLSPGP